MKTVSLTVLCSCFLIISGCGPKFYPITGNYYGGNNPYQIETKKSKEDVWNKIIELFATRGLSIKLLDKSSGLIISEKLPFSGNDCTVENENGALVNPNAFIVCDKVVWQTIDYEPQEAVGEWNIRVVGREGKTLINVNLINIDVTYKGKLHGAGRSTGKFEGLISDFIK